MACLQAKVIEPRLTFLHQIGGKVLRMRLLTYKFSYFYSVRQNIFKLLPLVMVSALFSVLIFAHTGAGATESLLNHEKAWTGDFDGMVERHKIRALVPYSKSFYFLDGATQRGIAYEGIQIFKKWLNKELGKGHLKVRVVIVPTPRDKLFSDLVAGRGDIALGNITITPERLKIVDFSDPIAKGIKEIVVAGQGAPILKGLDDLAGKEVFVRTSSSYYENLKRLNAQFKKSRKKPVKILPAEEFLEDEDLMEMANGGLISFIVVDEHKAKAWEPIFENVKIYTDIAIRTGGEIAWAFRKNSPKLKEVINRFFAAHNQGTMLFNVITKRYLQNIKWVENALLETEFQRVKDAVEFFRKYGDKYDFDWLMLAALAYQESRIDQSKQSPAGAIGVMQILPATAKDPNVNIPNIEDMENNIHAGVKYLRFLRDRYFEKEPMDEANKTLFTFASYNAGPARVAKLRSEAENNGLDPNIWFRNVEIMAAKRIGRETVQYVSNIYKYYTAYRLIMEKLQLKEEAKKEKGL
jgi:membrane-bound lytic murein transglycosylase MltF